MRTCKFCGKEIKPGEFEMFFTEESIESKPCKECEAKQAKENKKVIDFEMKLHPDWYGPSNEVF